MERGWKDALVAKVRTSYFDFADAIISIVSVAGRITSSLINESFISLRAGTFITMPEKQTELIVPDLTGFPLKPYVAHNVKRNIREVNPQIAS
jgi:hypothetical protein